MNIKLHARALAASALAAMLLTACGGGDDDAPPPPPPSSELKDWPQVQSAFARDTSQEAQIQTILAGMTLAQKVGQMTQPNITAITPAEVRQYYIGSVLNGGGAWPGNDKRAGAAAWVALADAYWEASMNTDMAIKVPVIWGTDAVHGHNNLYGATLFPHNIGLGAANDPEMIERIGAAVARQVRTTGIDWTFAPTLAVVRDDRWGRTYEGFSEEPGIVGAYGGRFTTGLQGRFDTAGRPTVIATAKHFMGDGGTDMGKDQGETKASLKDMMNIHGAGYYTSLAAGAQTVMASFNTWTFTGSDASGTALDFSNVKMHGNKYLMTDVLKGKMGFDGLIVSDWNGIGQVVYQDSTGTSRTCTNSDCPPAINAGIDIVMVPDDWRAFITNTIAAVEAGTIPMARIDDAVSRILRVKMRAGILKLEGNQAVSTKPSLRPGVGAADGLLARDLAREAVRKSLVLLKNANGVLPLARGEKILVVGKNADNIANQSGGWSLTWQGTSNTNADFPNADSVLAGIREAAGDGNVTYSATGSGVDFAEYKAVIAVIGETPYAEGVGDIGRTGTLEHAKRYPEDLAVINAVSGKGIPVVTVLMSGRPLWMNRELNRSDAFVAAWLPGTEGKGVADVLFRKADGTVNADFSGKLSFSWPKQACQTTVNKGDATYDPLFAFGYGLSYAQGGTVPAALDETVPTIGCGQTAPSGPAATEDLSVYQLAESPLHKLYVGSPSGWSVPVGVDLNAVVTTGDGHVTVETAQVNVQQDAKRVTWTGTGQFMAQSVGATNDYTSYIVAGADAALVYDVIVNAAPQGNVMTRIDCMYPCFGELDMTAVLRALPLNQKSTVKIPLSCFISTGSKGTDFTLVDVPFLLYTEQPFTATFANIRWQVGAATDADAIPCSALQPPPPATIDPLPGPTATLFGTDGSYLTGFTFGTWSGNGTHVVADTTTTPGVIDLAFAADGDNGISFISGEPINLSNYANGQLTFELRVTNWGTNTSGLVIKMESTGTDCRNNDYPVPDRPAADGQFHTVTLNVADVAGSAFNPCFTLANIRTPFGIFPTWGDQQGVQFQVRNIRFTQ